MTSINKSRLLSNTSETIHIFMFFSQRHFMNVTLRVSQTFYGKTKQCFSSTVTTGKTIR